VRGLTAAKFLFYVRLGFFGIFGFSGIYDFLRNFLRDMPSLRDGKRDNWFNTKM
jgi:hypothetical protein